MTAAVPDWQRALFARRGAGVDFRVEVVDAVHRALGRPGAGIPTVHLVGTNGKGSTAALCSHALTRAGRRVGMFTSPHLHRLGERVRVQGEPLDDDALQTHVDRVLAVERRGALPRGLTFFEVITLTAMVAFADASLDALVIEAGVGGRLDSTRVCDASVVGVTPIDLDHKAWLGDTIAAIAAEKAAVLEGGIPCVSAPQAPDARAVLEDAARRFGSTLEFVKPLARAPEGLDGDHQRVNGAVALACARALAPDVTAAQLDGVRWPGRLERVELSRRGQGGGAVVLDVAHNPHGVAALVRHARRLIAADPARPRAVVFAGMADKDVKTMLALLAELGLPLWLTRPDYDRARAPDELAVLVPEGVARRVFPSTRDPAFTNAWRDHLDADGELWVCGSTFLVSELRARLLDAREDPLALRDPV